MILPQCFQDTLSNYDLHAIKYSYFKEKNIIQNEFHLQQEASKCAFCSNMSRNIMHKITRRDQVRMHEYQNCLSLVRTIVDVRCTCRMFFITLLLGLCKETLQRVPFDNIGKLLTEVKSTEALKRQVLKLVPLSVS